LSPDRLIELRPLLRPYPRPAFTASKASGSSPIRRLQWSGAVAAAQLSPQTW
jgi:hypothetical protein